MLDENQVIEFLCQHLSKEGYAIQQSCAAGDRGIDVIAQEKEGGFVLLIEAKVSPGSLKPASYGQFKTSQSLFVLIALFSFWTSAMLVAA